MNERRWYGARNGPNLGQERWQTRPGGYNVDQPRKRIRFSDFVKADKTRQNEFNQGRDNQAMTPPSDLRRPQNGLSQDDGKVEDDGRKGGVKHGPQGAPKRGDLADPPPGGMATSLVSGNEGEGNNFQPMPTAGQMRN